MSPIERKDEFNNKCGNKNDFEGKNFRIIINNNKFYNYCCRTCAHMKGIDKESNFKILCLKCNNTNKLSNKDCRVCGTNFYKSFCSKCDKYRNYDMFHCKYTNCCKKGSKKNYKFCKGCNEWCNINTINSHKCYNSYGEDCYHCNQKLDNKRKRIKLICGHSLHSECYKDILRNVKTYNDLKCKKCDSQLCAANKRSREELQNMNNKINNFKRRLTSKNIYDPINNYFITNKII